MQLKIEKQDHIGSVELFNGDRMYVSVVSRNGVDYISIGRANICLDKKTGKEELKFKNSIWIPINKVNPILELINQANQSVAGKSSKKLVPIAEKSPASHSNLENGTDSANMLSIFNPDAWSMMIEMCSFYTGLNYKTEQSCDIIITKLAKQIGLWYIEGVRNRSEVHRRFSKTYGQENAERLSTQINSLFDKIQLIFSAHSHVQILLLRIPRRMRNRINLSWRSKEVILCRLKLLILTMMMSLISFVSLTIR